MKAQILFCAFLIFCVRLLRTFVRMNQISFSMNIKSYLLLVLSAVFSACESDLQLLDNQSGGGYKHPFNQRFS